MKLLLFLPLLVLSQDSAHQAAEQALKSFLVNGTYSRTYCQTDCFNRITCSEKLRPDDVNKAEMTKLDSNALKITEAQFKENHWTKQVTFFVADVSKYFTAVIDKDGFILNSDRYICNAMGIAGEHHRSLSTFTENRPSVADVVPVEAYSRKWDRSHLHNPVIYQECGKLEKQISKENCGNGEADLMKRDSSDKILEAKFVEGSNFLKIKYTSITENANYKKNGVKTEFTIEAKGTRFEYTHMRDICE